MRVVTKTDIGNVREANEDAHAVGEFSDGVTWAVVCDGMGGVAGGKMASSLAVKVITEKLNASYNEKMRDSSIKNLLNSAISAANVEVYDMAMNREEYQGMGTTVVCIIIKDDVAYVAHVGDSRAYLSNKTGFYQITKDHSLVQSLIDKGEITHEEAKNHPKRNIITRAVGVEEEVSVDFNEVELKNDDTLIICTDGLTNYVSGREIYNEINDDQYYAFADRLVKRANMNGGGDNITVVAITY